jgi:hypothetical protein
MAVKGVNGGDAQEVEGKRTAPNLTMAASWAELSSIEAGMVRNGGPVFCYSGSWIQGGKISSFEEVDSMQPKPASVETSESDMTFVTDCTRAQDIQKYIGSSYQTGNK